MGDKGTVNIGDVRPSERTEPRLKPSRAVGDGKPKGTCIRKEASAMLTHVLASDGSPLMPTFNIKKVRKLFKSGTKERSGSLPVKQNLLSTMFWR